jgi:hypothetical protein
MNARGSLILWRFFMTVVKTWSHRLQLRRALAFSGNGLHFRNALAAFGMREHSDWIRWVILDPLLGDETAGGPGDNGRQEWRLERTQGMRPRDPVHRVYSLSIALKIDECHIAPHGTQTHAATLSPPSRP